MVMPASAVAALDPLLSINNALKDLQTSLNTKNELPINLPAGQGRTRHWSTYLLMGGAAIGVAYLIIGIVLTTPAIWVPGAILFVTNAIGAIYTKKFAMYKQEEDYLQILSARIVSINESVQALQSDKKALSDSVTLLQKTIDESKMIDKNGAAELSKEAKELNDAVTKLKDREAKLVQCATLMEPIQKENFDLKASLSQYKDNLTTLVQKVKDLTASVNKLNSTKDQIGQELTALQAEDKVIKASDLELKAALISAQEKIKLMASIIQQHMNDPELDQTISQITQGMEVTVNTVADAKKAGDQLQADRDALAQLLTEFKPQLSS